ncbi:MAG TPA: cellulase family glycosylhydrolase [Chloroflexia bacterium]|nr:cellulase family glycosylhydrolase [Chloroflexia bacterium]
MNKRLSAWLVPGLALAALLPSLGVAAQPAGVPATHPAAAPGTAPGGAPAFGDPTFQRLWTRTDQPVASHQTARSWFWGPTPGTMMSETYTDAPDGSGQRLVQYFDKSRMEINDPSKSPSDPFYVTNGLLTVELISGKMQIGNSTFETRHPAEIPVAGDYNDPNAPTYASFGSVSNVNGTKPSPDHTGQQATQVIHKDGSTANDPGKSVYPKIDYVYYDTVSQHNIPRAFWEFLNQQGPVNVDGTVQNEQLINPWFYASGRPISEPYWANVLINGKPTDTLIQAYERRVLTYVPTNSAGFQVEMGNIGLHYRDWRYGGPGKVGSFPLSGPHPGYGFNVWLFDTDANRVLQVAKAAGFTWVRQQVVWADYQPTPGRIKWDRLDPIVAAAQANGVQLILSVVRSPAWAGPNGGMPDDKFTFAGFMYQMAKRYQTKVAAYEIWNEENYAAESGGTVNLGQYVNLLQVGYSAIKYADPTVVVMSGGLTPVGLNDPKIAVNDVEYLKQFYAYQGGVAKSYYDVLGAHPGSNNNSPDQKWPDNPGNGHCPDIYKNLEGTCWRNDNSFYFRRVEDLRAVMEANGEANKQMWLTEFGWSTYNYAPGYEYGQVITAQMQADYLVRAFQKGKNDYPWMGVMCVWNLNFSTLPNLSDQDEKVPWSVINRDYSPRLAYTALQAMPK